ncbi:MAG: sodium ion-translocating decarboxylase subunit beta [Kiritimatiellia bacterium]|jgi:sodium ion-translocating decarboxylase beta subunit
MLAVHPLLTGITNLGWPQVIMIAIGCLMIWLAIKKEYEPMLLLPIGFGAILANIPFSAAVAETGFLSALYDFGIENELFPILIFIGVGAMIDFSPLLTQPVTIFFGGAAQLGIFVAMLLALCANFIHPGLFSLKEAAAIGIIGAADGPTSIYVGRIFAPKYIAPITVAAYSYMALVPIIQPPVIRLLTSKEERRIRMPAQSKTTVSRRVRILFPIGVTIVAGIVSPESTALIGSLMFGNLVRECGVLERLSNAAQNELSNLVTLLLGITIGGTMDAESFLTIETAFIMGIGLLAFVFDTAGGVLAAKFANLFLKRKINPMIGACGISAFPMSSRIVQKLALEEDPYNVLIMQAAGANVAGQVGSVIAGAMLLHMLGG